VEQQHHPVRFGITCGYALPRGDYAVSGPGTMAREGAVPRVTKLRARTPGGDVLWMVVAM
jgi:hypothetical protein